MKKSIKFVVSIIVLVVFVAVGLLTTHTVSAHQKAVPQETAFHDAMRKLWEDHITWTRLYIISAASGLPDLTATGNRLMQNQADIGDAIKPFYGDAAGNQLTALLKDHIAIAGSLIEAAKSGDTQAFNTTLESWYVNADEIATFLSTANPTNWQEDEMKSMMRTHLDLTLKEAAARLNGDYVGDIAAYEEVHIEILKMADMLSAGIINQFPKMFR